MAQQYKNIQEYLDSLKPEAVTPETVVTTIGTVDVTDRPARELGKVSLKDSDAQIGAVEIKDGTSATRAVVSSASQGLRVYLSVYPDVDLAGGVFPSVADWNGSVGTYLPLVGLGDGKGWDDAAGVVPVSQNLNIPGGVYQPTLDTNLGASAAKLVKASAGNVFSISCYNATAVGAQFAQLYDLSSATIGAATPLLEFIVFPKNQIVIGTDFFTNAGLHFASGIVFGWSTTSASYVAGTAGDQRTYITFK